MLDCNCRHHWAPAWATCVMIIMIMMIMIMIMMMMIMIIMMMMIMIMITADTTGPPPGRRAACVTTSLTMFSRWRPDMVLLCRI